MFATTFFVSLLAVASAVPTNGPSQSCGSNNKVYCCDSASADQAVGGLLGGINLSNLLGGNCDDITAAVLGGAVPIKSQCDQQAVCCSDVQQVGLVNVGCTPIMV